MFWSPDQARSPRGLPGELLVKITGDPIIPMVSHEQLWWQIVQNKDDGTSAAADSRPGVAKGKAKISAQKGGFS